MMDEMREKRILLVDDEPDILNLVKTVLHKEGFEYVLKATTGDEAIRLCRKYKPDIIVLDIMLPDMEGYDVCKAIREFSAVPIIFLSAKTDEIDRLLSFAIGGDDYLAKPFSPKEVVYRIRAILRRTLSTEKPVDQVIEIHDLVISQQEGVVCKKGKKLKLTPMEFHLLLYFVENKNIVLSKEQLLDHVWGMDFEGSDNTIMVHISHLREKIEDDHTDPKYIQTIKKMGYKFVG